MHLHIESLIPLSTLCSWSYNTLPRKSNTNHSNKIKFHAFLLNVRIANVTEIVTPTIPVLDKLSRNHPLSNPHCSPLNEGHPEKRNESCRKFLEKGHTPIQNQYQKHNAHECALLHTVTSLVYTIT